MLGALLLLLGAFGLQPGNLDAGFSVNHQRAVPKTSRRPPAAPSTAAFSGPQVATCFAPLERAPAKPAVTALLSSLRAGCACLGGGAAAVDDDATFPLRLDHWAALRLRLYLAWVRHGRSFLDFPVAHLARPVGRAPEFRDAGALAVEYGVLLTPASFVGAGAGYVARVRAGRACRLLAAAAGEARLGPAGGAAAWDAAHTLLSIELPPAAAGAPRSSSWSPLWREVARRAALLAGGGSLPELDGRSDDGSGEADGRDGGARPAAASGPLRFSPAHLDAAVRSVSLYVASSRHVRARLTLHPTPPPGSAAAAAAAPVAAASERDLQFEAYRYLPRDAPADVRAAAAHAKLHPVPAVNSSQSLLGVAHVYHYENTSATPTGTTERWMVLVRAPRKHGKGHRGGGGLRRMDEEDHPQEREGRGGGGDDNDEEAVAGSHHRRAAGDSGSSSDEPSPPVALSPPVRGARYMAVGADNDAVAGAGALPALAATRAYRHAVDVLPVAYNRFVGQFYHTLGELTTALLPLQGLLAAVDGGVDGGDDKPTVLLPSAWVHPLVESAGFGRRDRDGLRLRAATEAGAVSYARLLLTADPVPVNWPDVVALLGVRERIYAAVLGPGVPQDPLDYLRGGSGNGVGGDGEAQRVIRRRARQLTASQPLPRWRRVQEHDELATEEDGDGEDGGAADDAPGMERDGSSISADSPAMSLPPLGCPGVVAAATGGGGGDPHPHRRPRVVLIRRRRSRVIANWDALAAAVNATGADVAVFDDDAPLPRREALALFASADAVVAAHGAGLTNLLACASGTAVLEVVAAGWRQANYVHLSAVLGHDYHRWVVPGGSQHQATITVPLPDVLAALCGVLRQRAAAAAAT
jgi:hypothetical protein